MKNVSNNIMLKLVDIKKIYKSGTGNVEALKEINLSFRKNEFVSILGPSGSGKTTLLNIIGGLDKYTEGDLIIAGKSTKDFKDRDWDKYRSLRIGFIFQSYNLIPHQTVLSNVELALTITGVEKEERKKRAIEALEKVGLKDQIYKKPNQLSGGQCQRVAIARSLVNNPEILLADEPTGALDTKTSEQIMNLIKDIAKDRLVIMVTHNPELAERYSTRIINLKDGQIENDSNPVGSKTSLFDEGNEEKTTKAKMGFLTTLHLSFNNLISKKKRTILVSVACSIGIIGVSTVLSISSGVTNYIGSMQDDMLSSYPLEIAEESVDLTALTSGLTSDDGREIAKFDINTQVGMDSMINYLMTKYSDMTNVKTNDINQNLVNFVEETPSEYLSAIQYDYGIDVTNNIFTNWTSSSVSPESQSKKWVSLNGLTQRYISELKTVDGFNAYASYVDLFTNFMKQFPGEKDYILSQYDMLGDSTYASGKNEIMLVVDKNSTLTDLTLGQMGYYDHDSFIMIGQKAVKLNELKKQLSNKEITQEQYDAKKAELDEKYAYKTAFNYTDLIGSEFYYFPSKNMWEYGNVSSDISYTGYILFTQKDIEPKSNVCFLNYTKFEDYGMNLDLLTGMIIAPGSQLTQVAYVRNAVDPSSVSKEAFLDGTWVGIDTSTYQYDPTKSITISNNGSHGLIKTLGYSDIEFDKGNVELTTTGTKDGYNYPLVAKDEWINNPEAYGAIKLKVSGILRAKTDIKFGSLSRGVYYTKEFANQYISDGNDSNNKIVNDVAHGIKAFFNSGEASESTYNAYVTYSYIDYSNENDLKMIDNGYARALNGSMDNAISSLFSSATGGIDYTNTNSSYLRSLSGLKAVEGDLVYSFDKLPKTISIYPKTFDDKDKVTSYLNKWNSSGDITVHGKVITKNERKDLSYTDTVQMIITVINTLITIVSSALVAFTSLSLVVSCFMIAVITYISVMERVKEIGVIRSLGGRKRDVSRLFTAENLMTGFASGVIGIAVTYLLSGLINIIISRFGVPSIAMLPWWLALIMILVAIALNVLSGTIPSRKAAKQDPVEALRSE